MTDEADHSEPEKRNRVRRYGLFMHDVEMFDELGIPEKLGRKVFQHLDKPLPGRRRFPQPIPFLGDRRCWPAVKRYFMEEFGGLPSDATTITRQGNFNETDQARRHRDPRSRLATSQ